MSKIFTIYGCYYNSSVIIIKKCYYYTTFADKVKGLSVQR